MPDIMPAPAGLAATVSPAVVTSPKSEVQTSETVFGALIAGLTAARTREPIADIAAAETKPGVGDVATVVVPPVKNDDVGPVSTAAAAITGPLVAVSAIVGVAAEAAAPVVEPAVNAAALAPDQAIVAPSIAANKVDKATPAATLASETSASATATYFVEQSKAPIAVAAPSLPPAAVSTAVVAAPESAPMPSVGTGALPVVNANRTFEDAVAEMLRPMLRQWLDSNMPKLVEKALASEIQQPTGGPVGKKPDNA